MKGSPIPELSTDAIALDVQVGVPVTIKHGLGRQVRGYLVIWQTAVCALRVADASADTSTELVLIPDAASSLRLVLL